MGEVGIRALKQNASEVVAAVATGEAVTITDRGRPVAKLVPLSGGRLSELREAGRLRPARRALSELPPPVVSEHAVGVELLRARDTERY